MALSSPIPKPADMYGTHIPVLRALPRVRLAFEFGCGWNSTPCLAAMSDALRSWDEGAAWAEALTAAAKGAYGVTHALPDIVTCAREALAREVPELAFVDHGIVRVADPHTRGAVALLCLQAGVRFVVCHDTEPHLTRCYGWQPCYDLAKYRLDWPGAFYANPQPDGRLPAWTSILSMTDDLAEVRRNLRMAR